MRQENTQPKFFVPLVRSPQAIFEKLASFSEAFLTAPYSKNM